LLIEDESVGAGPDCHGCHECTALMSETICVFTGLRVVDPGTDADVSVAKDFTLLKLNSVILSALPHDAMNQYEYEEAKDYRYLMYRRTFCVIRRGH